MNFSFTNPIIGGFAPDPSIVFVDHTFFLVNSSFHIFPGLPIYASSDLRNWRHIGNAVNRPGQINLARTPTVKVNFHTGGTLIAAAGLYAPTIRYNNGIFYIICTYCHGEDGNIETQNFIITTKDIWSNEWSDPIWIDFRGIDPSLFFDNDGKVYVQGSWRPRGLTEMPECTIGQFEIDIETGRSLSETKEIWRGFAGKNDAEGPHIYVKDQYYYLLTAEAGTFEQHLVAIARSKSIWGPYESYSQNPILTSYQKNEFVQNTGHGDLFEDATGNWWIVCLGIQNAAGRYPMGRETFIAPVIWPEGGWPCIEQPRVSFKRILELTEFQNSKIFQRQIPTKTKYVHIRGVNLSHYQISPDCRSLTLRATQATLSSPTSTLTFIGQRQRSFVCDSTTELLLSPAFADKQRKLRAGLAVYKDEFRHAGINFDVNESKMSLVLRNIIRGENEIVLAQRILSENLGDQIGFKIQATELAYQFWYKLGQSVTGDGNGWTFLGAIDSAEMTAQDFTGTLFGVFASCTDANPGDLDCWVTFKNFQVQS